MVRLNLTTCAHESLQADLRKGVIDLAFLLTDSIKAADIEVETVGFESIVPVVSPIHPLASKKRVRTTDLRGHTLLVSTVDCSYRRIFERMLEEEGVPTQPKLVFHSVEALKRCVVEGVGITFLPEIAVANDIEKGRLARLPWDEERLEVAVLMIWYKQRWVSPTLSAFIETTRKLLKQN